MELSDTGKEQEKSETFTKEESDTIESIHSYIAFKEAFISLIEEFNSKENKD